PGMGEEGVVRPVREGGLKAIADGIVLERKELLQEGETEPETRHVGRVFWRVGIEGYGRGTIFVDSQLAAHPRSRPLRVLDMAAIDLRGVPPVTFQIDMRWRRAVVTSPATPIP